MKIEQENRRKLRGGVGSNERRRGRGGAASGKREE